MRAARILLQDCTRDQSRLWVDRAPSGETARQNLKRQYRGRYHNEAFVGFLRAPGRRSLLEESAKLLMRFDEVPQPGLPQDVRKARIAMQFMITDDQALALRRQALRQETEIKVLDPAGESHATHIICSVCHSFHRHASCGANRFRSLQQHNDSRHISSMGKRSQFHRKKIAETRLV